MAADPATHRMARQLKAGSATVRKGSSQERYSGLATSGPNQAGGKNSDGSDTTSISGTAATASQIACSTRRW